MYEIGTLLADNVHVGHCLLLRHVCKCLVFVSVCIVVTFLMVIVLCVCTYDGSMVSCEICT